MPGQSEHSKISKRKQASGRATQQQQLHSDQKEEPRLKRRKGNQPHADEAHGSGAAAEERADDGPARRPLRGPQSSLAALQRMFEVDSDDELPVNNPNRAMPNENNILPDNIRALFMPSHELERMFEADGVIEQEVIIADLVGRDHA